MNRRNTTKASSRALGDGESTGLGKALRPQLEQHPGQSGVRLLGNGRDAFGGRAQLARLSERSIDLQYYMFHQDTVGRLLIRELLAAADRGVRVRLLIDDMYGGEADDVWSALDAHPAVEVRLFNPFKRGYSKNLQFLTRMTTVNHRMHSKTFTVDNQVSIVGGRNIGDEYFDADPDLAFSDLDVMAIGPVVPEVSEELDQYWNSEHARPMAALRATAPPGALDGLRHDLAEFFLQQRTRPMWKLWSTPSWPNLWARTVEFGFGQARSFTTPPRSWPGRRLERRAADVAAGAMHIAGDRGVHPGVALLRARATGRRCPVRAQPQRGAGARPDQLARFQRRRRGAHGVRAAPQAAAARRRAAVRAERADPEGGGSPIHLASRPQKIQPACQDHGDRKAMFVGSFNFDQRSCTSTTRSGSSSTSRPWPPPR